MEAFKKGIQDGSVEYSDRTKDEILNTIKMYEPSGSIVKKGLTEVLGVPEDTDLQMYNIDKRIEEILNNASRSKEDPVLQNLSTTYTEMGITREDITEATNVITSENNKNRGKGDIYVQ
ncbi:MAG: hypothetical protein IJV31_12525 [Clostridia bacterium]|nr:hypothetical protein [Clostridia bacterium]